MGLVATVLGTRSLASSVVVDVMTRVLRRTVVEDAFSSRGSTTSRGCLLVDGTLPLVPWLFWGCLTLSRGRAFSLLDGRDLEEPLDLISYPQCMRIRGRRHVPQQHSCRKYILACSREVGWLGWRFRSSVVDDAVEDAPCFSSSAQGSRRERMVLLERALEQLQICAFLIHLGLDLSELGPLCRSSVVLRSLVTLGLWWRSARLDHLQGSSCRCSDCWRHVCPVGCRDGRGGAISGLLIRRDVVVEVTALTSRVIAP
jgi:hypothetical protein